jgi:hypothetical protein
LWLESAQQYLILSKFQIDSTEPAKVNIAVISQEDFAKIRPNSFISNPSRPPPPPPINTPCVTGSLLPGHLDHTNDLDQLDFTFGDEEEDDPNASMNRTNRYKVDQNI